MSDWSHALSHQVVQANLFLLEVEEAHQVPREASEEQVHQEGEGGHLLLRVL
jgi:hypothetical protein